MPYAGLGLHILLALFCAVHVVRTGQPLYWLFILFSFPLLGSVVYILMIYLPNSRLERGAWKAMSKAARALDPTKEVRLAREAFEHTPTAQNQMRLAAALLDIGQAQEAARLYEAGLKGPFATDADMRLGAARAFTECGRFAEALPHIEALRDTRPEFRPDTVHMLWARCLAGTARAAEARVAFESAIEKYGTFEAYAEYQIWALSQGDTATSQKLQPQIDSIMKRWNAMSRQLNEGSSSRLRAAQASSR
jgi:hypothetical protein